MKTNWSQAPPRLAKILDTWEDIGRKHIGKPDLVFNYAPKQRKALMANATALAEEYATLEIGVGDYEDCMWWTYRYMISHKLTVGTHPMALAFGAKDWLREKTGTDRRRYLLDETE